MRITKVSNKSNKTVIIKLVGLMTPKPITIETDKAKITEEQALKTKDQEEPITNNTKTVKITIVTITVTIIVTITVTITVTTIVKITIIEKAQNLLLRCLETPRKNSISKACRHE